MKPEWAPVLSGVLQGTFLGPYLFSLYINNISSDIDSEIRRFADNCSIYREVRDVGVSMKLQKDIDITKTRLFKYIEKVNTKI